MSLPRRVVLFLVEPSGLTCLKGTRTEMGFSKSTSLLPRSTARPNWARRDYDSGNARRPAAPRIKKHPLGGVQRQYTGTTERSITFRLRGPVAAPMR